MPTGNAIADGMTKTADMTGEASVQDVLSGGFVPSTPITPTLDPKSYIQQSTDVLRAGMNNPAIPQLFGKVEASGRKARESMDIIDEKYRQEELKRLPLEGLQKEVDDLQMRRARVLPDMLSDGKIVDFNAKLRLSTMLQSIFDREIDKTLSRKKELEEGAASRAQMKVDSLRAKASIYDKQAEQDKYMLSTAMDMFQSGSASLQDILEAAITMEENNAKRKKAGSGKDSNPFLGVPGQGFTDEEISAFLVAERNQGKLELSDSVGTQYRMRMNARYKEWLDMGKPVQQRVRAEGPATMGGVVPTVMDVLTATNDNSLFGKPGYYVNPFPERKSGGLEDILMQSLVGGMSSQKTSVTPEIQE